MAVQGGTRNGVPVVLKGSAPTPAAPVSAAAAPTTSAVDVNYQLQPGESAAQYNARVAQYNTTKAQTAYAGGQATVSTAGGIPSKQGGTLTADISSPKTKTIAAPAVVTSSAAERDLANKKMQVDQLHADTAEHKAIVTAPPAPTGDLPGKDIGTPAAPEKPATLDDQLNSILGDLSANQQHIQEQASEVANPLMEQRQQAQQEFDTAAVAAINKLNRIASGTYPLSVTEKSLLSSTEDTYRATIAAQQTANEAYTGQMTELMASLGISTSAPTQAIGMIHAAISTGESKIADLNGKMASKIAELTQGFQQQDYKMVSDAWNATSDFMKERITSLKDMQKEVLDAAHQQQQDLKDYAQLTLNTMISSANFTETQKQHAIDNAFQKMQITETQRHNLQTEAVAWKQVEANGSGGGNFTTTQINDGAAKAGVPVDVFKGWSADAKNVFINGDVKGTKKTVDDGLAAGSVGDVVSAIKDLKLPPQAEQYFIDYATKNDSGASTLEKRGTAFTDTFTDLMKQGYDRHEALDEVKNEWSDSGKSTITKADERLIQNAADSVYGLSFLGIPDAPLPGTETSYWNSRKK